MYLDFEYFDPRVRLRSTELRPHTIIAVVGGVIDDPR